MIKAGTKVKVAINQFDRDKVSPLITLLNTLEAEVLTSDALESGIGRQYAVAFDLDQLPAIQKARNEEEGVKFDCQLPIVGLNVFLGRPKDARFWYNVYSDEIRV